ncbi:MAG: hypothetical protein IIA27_06700 [Gemmatimonadetes bacterium]|nr:hypothetical protein [Gemmatimonadota bacterium]
MNVNFGRAALAGIIGAAVMTVVGLYGAPMMGIPEMNPADMLADQMGGSAVMGWIAHFMIGVILAEVYAVVAGSLPGPVVVRGALYGLAPWLLAQVAVMPMMGMGFFSGAMNLAMGSLIGHIIYGGVVGAVYGEPSPDPTPVSTTS